MIFKAAIIEALSHIPDAFDIFQYSYYLLIDMKIDETEMIFVFIYFPFLALCICHLFYRIRLFY